MRLLAVLALLAFLVQSEPGDVELTRTVSNGETFVVLHRVAEGRVELGELFDLEVRLQEAEGERPLAGVDGLHVDARMPHHGHGMNVAPKVVALAEGRYAISGYRLHMPGYWELHFDVTRGAVTERAQVSLELE